jgi:hypothetical protein
MPISTEFSVILAPATAGANSDQFKVDHLPTTLALSGAAAVLAGAETVTLQRLDQSGTWRDVVDPVAGAAVLAAGENCLRIIASGTYRGVKTATAALVGLEIQASTLS